MDYRQLIDHFPGLMDSHEKARQFLAFAARHPDLSPDNTVLLYLQDPEAPRFLVPMPAGSGGREDDGPSQGEEERPYSLLGVADRDGTLTAVPRLMLPVPQEGLAMFPSPDLSARAVCDRIGYALVPDRSLSQLRTQEEQHLIVFPGDWSGEELLTGLCPFLTDHFRRSFEPIRKGLLVNPSLDLSEDSWRRHYRGALVFLAAKYLGCRGSFLPKNLVPWLFDRTAAQPDGACLSRSRMCTLLLYLSSLVQMLEGRHFTVTETDIFRACRGKIYDSRFRVSGQEDAGLGAEYLLFLERYVSDCPEDVDWRTVPYFPPFRLRAGAPEADG